MWQYIDKCQPNYHGFGPVRDVKRKKMFQYLNDFFDSKPDQIMDFSLAKNGIKH